MMNWEKLLGKGEARKVHRILGSLKIGSEGVT